MCGLLLVKVPQGLHERIRAAAEDFLQQVEKGNERTLRELLTKRLKAKEMRESATQ